MLFRSGESGESCGEGGEFSPCGSPVSIFSSQRVGELARRRLKTLIASRGLGAASVSQDMAAEGSEVEAHLGVDRSR